MTPEACKALAASARFATLATIDPSGTSNLVPMVFALMGAGTVLVFIGVYVAPPAAP